MLRARVLAVPALAAALLVPVTPAHAETVKTSTTGFAQGSGGSSFIVVACRAEGSGRPASTEVWCQINSAVPEYFGAPGPHSVALWYGSADMPVKVCVWGRATYGALQIVNSPVTCEYMTPP